MYSTEVLADSPTFYAKMDEASGNIASEVGGHTGTASGTPVYAQAGPITGSSAINVAAGHFSVADHADLDLGDGPFSIEFWAKRIDFADAGHVLGKTDATLAVGGYAIEQRENATLDTLRLQIGTGASHLNNSTDLFNNADWHHVVFTRALATTALMYVDGSSVAASQSAVTFSDNNLALIIGAMYTSFDYYNGLLSRVALYKTVLTPTRIAAHYAETSDATSPVWTTPADTVAMSPTPDLKFTSPASASKQHFQMQLDTANTFNTGNLRTYDSSVSQTNWTYYNGGSWVALPSDGLPIAYAGNEVDYTVTSALSTTTWYRRVRAGTL